MVTQASINVVSVLVVHLVNQGRMARTLAGYAMGITRHVGIAIGYQMVGRSEISVINVYYPLTRVSTLSV